MATTILGRVQGGSIFYSTAASGTSIDKNTLQPTNIAPLIGDSILFSNGDLRNITVLSDNLITCSSVVTSLKGEAGPAGVAGEAGPAGPTGPAAATYSFDAKTGVLTITTP